MIHFHEHLTPNLQPITTVTQHPDNPNNGDTDAIAESMQTNGVYAGVIAQKTTGHILAGNHRYAALLQLGATQIPVTWLDITNEQATRILLADNRTTRLGHDDEHLLATLLDDLTKTPTGLTGTGYTNEDLLALTTIAFAPPAPQTNTTIQLVIDFTTQDDAEHALDNLQQTYPDARLTYG